MKPEPHHIAEYWANASVQQKLCTTKLCMAESLADPCDSRIVHAHTVPRSQLQKIAVDGHVYSFSAAPADLIRNEGKIVAKKIGINKFSTLNCFCAKHDNDLFAPIEDEPLAFTPLQLALLHYRTLASEMYRKVTAHASVTHHLDSEKRKSAKARRPEVIKMMEVMAFGEALGIRDCGSAFGRAEKNLFEQNFGAVSALVVHFKRMPTVLTVAGFLPQYTYRGERIQRLGDPNSLCSSVAFNILSSQGHAALAMLWFKDETSGKALAESFIAQKSELLTTLAIQTCFEHFENSCMAPVWWEGLHEAERGTLSRRMQAAGTPFEPHRADSLTYCGVTFDQWDYDCHEFINA
jgi:hypothetical protein